MESIRGISEGLLHFPRRAELADREEADKLLIVLVGAEGFEPPTLCSQSRCATRLRYAPIFTGLFLEGKLVGTGRFELPTPRTPSECSTRLSHVPTTRVFTTSNEFTRARTILL